MTNRMSLTERQERWARLGAMARRLVFNLVDEVVMFEILESAGEEIWRSMQWWGRPDSRGDHVRSCTCGDCS